MSESLSKLVQNVIASYLEAKEDRGKAKAFGDEITRLIKNLQAVGVQVESLGEERQHDSAVRAIDDRLIIAEGTNLADFFRNVGEAVIEGQQTLDQRSISYNRGNLESRDRQRIPPTWFAIPNVKAEMKLGFSQAHGKGVNVVLFQSSEQKERYGESTITFEIAAAPAPPNAQFKEELAEQPLGPFSPSERVTEDTVDGRSDMASQPVSVSLSEWVSEDMLDGRPDADMAPQVDPTESVSVTITEDAGTVPRESAPNDVPLRGKNKTAVTKIVASALPEEQRKFLLSSGTLISILPSSREVKRAQTILLLAGRKSPNNRQVHFYHGEVSTKFLARLEPFTYKKPLKEARGVVAPTRAELAEWAKSDTEQLRHLIRTLMESLQLILRFADETKPDFMLDQRTFDEDLSKQKTIGGEILKVVHSAKGIFHAPGKARIVLAPIEATDGATWIEFKAVVFSGRGKPRLTHIPLSRLKRENHTKLVQHIEDVKSLILDLLQVFEHAKPS